MRLVGGGKSRGLLISDKLGACRWTVRYGLSLLLAFDDHSRSAPRDGLSHIAALSNRNCDPLQETTLNGPRQLSVVERVV